MWPAAPQPQCEQTMPPLSAETSCWAWVIARKHNCTQGAETFLYHTVFSVVKDVLETTHHCSHFALYWSLWQTVCNVQKTAPKTAKDVSAHFRVSEESPQSFPMGHICILQPSNDRWTLSITRIMFVSPSRALVAASSAFYNRSRHFCGGPK